jgi:hypothetical protein
MAIHPAIHRLARFIPDLVHSPLTHGGNATPRRYYSVKHKIWGQLAINPLL